MNVRFHARTPVYKQLADIIRKSIENGEYAPGQQIPPEHTLCKMYHISRVTVRKSLQLLTDEGILERCQGKGTFVSMSDFIESSSAKGSFTLSCIQNGVRPSTKILSCEETDCDEKIRKDLGLENDEKVIIVVRVRCANDIPVIYETDYIPAKDHSYLLSTDLTDASLMDEMSSKAHVTFGGYDDMIDVRYAKERHAESLRCKKNAPLLGIYQKVFDTDGNIVYINEQIINSERYKYISVHRK